LSSVRSQNDLNPRIWSRFSLSNFYSLKVAEFVSLSCGRGRLAREMPPLCNRVGTNAGIIASIFSRAN
jgi:hypothetical protein